MPAEGNTAAQEPTNSQSKDEHTKLKMKYQVQSLQKHSKTRLTVQWRGRYRENENQLEKVVGFIFFILLSWDHEMIIPLSWDNSLLSHDNGIN